MNLMVDAAVRTSLVVLAALGVTTVLSRRSAALRHWILTVGIACAAATPLLQLALPSWRIAPPILTADAPSGQATVSTAVVVRVPRQPAETGPIVSADGEGSRASLPMIVLSIWLAGALSSLCVLVVGLRRLSRAAAAARPVTSGALFSVATDIRHAIGLRRRVRLLQSLDPAPLATWGVFRPTLILPADAPEWPEDRVRLVLRHELAHVARGDWAAQMLAETLRVLLWFNPLLWVASRRLRQESERACDDEVLGSGVAPADYASHLLDLARRARPWPVRSALAMARPSSLEGRVRAMFSTSVSRRPLKRATRIAALVAFAALTVPVAAAQGRFWSFSGTVVDQTDRVVPDAVLVLSNESARAKFEVRTDAAGHFEFQALPSGDYTLAVQKPGFKALNEAVSITGGDVSRTLELHVGGVSESITVIGPRADPSTVDPQRLARGQRAREEARKRASERCGGGAPAGEAGGQIVPPMKLVDVRPDYPEALKAAGVAGVVTLNAVIGTDGTVRDVTVVSSPHSDLERLASEAVRQWEFTPTYLNCTAIDVEMRVTVAFGAK